MRNGLCKVTLVVVALAGLSYPGATASADPDVIVCDISGTQNYGSFNGRRGYAIGTTSRNIGTTVLTWIDDGGPQGNLHPVIAQDLYRLKDGKFEQIGMSWLKHGWCGADSGFCGGPCTPGPAGCDDLGIGCADTYGAGLNGSQPDLGPRSEVDPVTGFFPYPYNLNWNQSGNATFKRLNAAEEDILPAMNPGASYFVQAHYVHPEDAGGLDDNNASWKRATFSSGGTLSLTGITHQQEPVIFAWQDEDPQVTITPIDLQNDGRVYLGTRVREVSPGEWHYEYAIQNLNARGIGGFTVIVEDSSAVMQNTIDFHDVDHHSGEPYSGADWPNSVSTTKITWSTESFNQNQNANAIRWGQLFNFRFHASTEPVIGTVQLQNWRTGGVVFLEGLVPSAPELDCALDGDLNDSSTVDGLDIAPYVSMATGIMTVSPCADLAAPFDSNLDNADLIAFVNEILSQ